VADVRATPGKTSELFGPGNPRNTFAPTAKFVDVAVFNSNSASVWPPLSNVLLRGTCTLPGAVKLTCTSPTSLAGALEEEQEMITSPGNSVIPSARTVGLAPPAVQLTVTVGATVNENDDPPMEICPVRGVVELEFPPTPYDTPVDELELIKIHELSAAGTLGEGTLHPV
jgi:hypothetical protein